MKPEDFFSGKTYFERRAEARLRKGLPNDRKQASATPPVQAKKTVPPAVTTVAGGLRGGVTVNSQDMYNAILRSMNNFSVASGSFTFTTAGIEQVDPKFSGKEFAAGVARGARSFKIDPLGRLTGIHYPQVWVPGENLAACKATPRHKEGDFAEKCRCGFYGYYDGSNDYHSDGLVSGVIEGYGEAVLGSRGFRVTKARIVALTIADDAAGPLARLVRRNYGDIPFFDTFTRMVSEFPPDYELDAAAAPSPESDPDFWTRNA